jgi:SAM-dependent methyltransferase
VNSHDIRSIFDAASAKHDESWRASLYLTEEQQYASFSIMSGVVHPYTSVLDIGCGHGDLGATLKMRMGGLAYTGVDLSGEAICKATKKDQARRLPEPKPKFVLGDFFELDLQQADVVTALGTFNLRADLESSASQYEYLRTALQRCFDLCGRRVGVTLTVQQADVKFDNSMVFYYDPLKVHEIVSKITPYYSINTMALAVEAIVVLSRAS